MAKTPPVVQLAVAFGTGLWSGLVFLPPLSPIWILLCISAVSCFKLNWRNVLAVSVSLGFATGGSVANAGSRACSTVWEPGPVSVILRIHDKPGVTGRTSASVLHAPEGCRGTTKLRFDSATHVPGGVRVLVVGEYRGRGVLKAGHVRVVSGSRSLRYAARDKVASRIRELYGARSGLVEAVVLGRREDIDRSLREGFARAGLAHLLAISGLHVGVLGGWCVLLARVLGARRRAWAWAVAAES